MITVGDLRTLLATPAARSRGMGAIVPTGPGLYTDTDTGRDVIPYGNGTYLDTNGGYIMDETGRIISRLDSPRSAPSTSTSQSDALSDIRSGIATGGSLVAEAAKIAAPFIPGRSAPPPVQAKSKPWTTGEKVALGLAIGVPLAGAAAWAAGVFNKAPRRRRRRG